MGIFGRNRHSGLMDEIRCDESSYLIWKWHPTDAQPGRNNRENSIRWGSSLRVKDGEVSVFVYQQADGTLQDYIAGPDDILIETGNLPVLSSIIGLAYDGGTPFQAEVYFINLANIIQVKFAVPYFDVFDPRFADFGVPVAVRGTISFRITDYRDFIRLHRLSTFSISDFQCQIRDAAARYVKDAVANAPAQHDIPIVQIESKTVQINDIVEFDIGKRLKEDFGVTVSGIDIAAIEIDKSSDGYKQLMYVTKDITIASVQAEADAKIKDIYEKQRIDAENYAGILRIQREESQYAQRKSTQTSNMGAFQVEKQAEVGIAGANALGQMGSNGSGNVDFGGGGGLNMAGMMASIAVGGAVGQNIAGMMNDIMGQSLQTKATPPPIPVVEYYVAVNGQATGPFSLESIKTMAANGELKGDGLIWKAGMADWAEAARVDGLKNLFSAMPPIPPVN